MLPSIDCVATRKGFYLKIVSNTIKGITYSDFPVDLEMITEFLSIPSAAVVLEI